MSKRLGILGLLALLVIGIIVLTSGGSSDHSSEWSSPDEATLRMDIESQTELSSEQMDCIVDKIKAGFPPSVNDQTNSDQHDEIGALTKDCIGDSSSSDSSDPTAGLAGCEDDPQSSLCIEEATARGIENTESYLEEEDEAFEEGYGEEEYEDEEYNPNYENELEELEEVKPPSEK